jgi:predicted AAA+ superfamily ATPase
VGAPLGVGHVTSQRYTDVLAHLYLVRTLQPWYTNELKRLIKTPKLHFLDSGLLAALRNLSSARFIIGLVLYDHDTIVPFGERLFAAPISTLWK